ncbi:MAG: RnfABCDGE type electron transport complex subunit G [bacterium]|nr:MAG: RnfABCDGE type electron transport complex subunit G [bacterium]
MMKGIGRLILVLAVICAGAAFALSLVFAVTKEPIAYQKKLEVIRSLQAVLPGLAIDPDRDFIDVPREEGEALRIFRSPSDDGIAGVAFEVIAPDGYSGNIYIMMGVFPDGTLGGIEILSHAETPGLGSLITEEEWKSIFKGRSLANTNFKVKKDGGDIDQITGATISPRAIAGAVEKGLRWFEANRDTVLAAGEGA